MILLRLSFVFGLLCFLPGLALAEEAGINQANTAWILTSTALVLFMTLPGLALFYGGLVRSKNVLSVLMQCFAIAAMASIIWLVAGYSLAFGEGNSWSGDFSKAMLVLHEIRYVDNKNAYKKIEKASKRKISRVFKIN